MTKFRASFTVLKLWSVGLPQHQEQAIKQYFKMPSEVASYMEEGKRMHEAWESEINASKSMPEIFGGQPLEWFKTETKLEIQIADWLELVGVLDLCHYEPELGGLFITDFKTGRTPSTNHLGSHQLGIYAALATAMHRNGHLPHAPKMVGIKHFNQYKGTVDNAYRHVDREMQEAALDWVITWASDMHNFLLENDVYADPYAFLGMVQDRVK